MISGKWKTCGKWISNNLWHNDTNARYYFRAILIGVIILIIGARFFPKETKIALVNQKQYQGNTTPEKPVLPSSVEATPSPKTVLQNDLILLLPISNSSPENSRHIFVEYRNKLITQIQLQIASSNLLKVYQEPVPFSAPEIPTDTSREGKIGLIKNNFPHPSQARLLLDVSVSIEINRRKRVGFYNTRLDDLATITVSMIANVYDHSNSSLLKTLSGSAKNDRLVSENEPDFTEQNLSELITTCVNETLSKNNIHEIIINENVH